VAHHINDHAIRVSNKEPANTPRLIRQRVNDLNGKSDGLRVHRVNIIDLNDYVRLWFGPVRSLAASHFSVRFVKRNRAFQLAGRIQDTNLTRPEARAGFGIANCLIFLREHRLDAWRFKDFPAPAMRSDLNHCHGVAPRGWLQRMARGCPEKSHQIKQQRRL
jgi:hypothetical protein